MAESLDRIVPLCPGGSLPPLFCVHAISGSAYAYQGLARLLGTDQPVFGLEAPGFDNDRAPLRSLPGLADEHATTLRAFFPSGPYRLLGWSMGGNLIVEIARRLSATGAEVSGLILVDSRMSKVWPLPSPRDILLRFLADMMGMSGESPPELAALSSGWPPHVEPGAVFTAVGAAGILPEEMDAGMLARQYAVFRAHLEAACSFAMTRPYRGPAVHIIAAESANQDGMGWRPVLPQVREITIPGSHYSIWTGERLVLMSQVVRQAIGQG